MKPTVSVIIPVLNRAKLIGRAMQSVLNQTELPLELIVVDNGSTDETVGVVKNFFLHNRESDCDFILAKEEKRGAWAARQKGLELAKGEYVYFLDSDDAMKPELIERATEVLKKDSEIDIVCWKSRINLLSGKKRVTRLSGSYPLEYHLIHGMLNTVGYMVRKSYLEKTGGWQKPLEVWDDYELGLRLLLKKPRIKLINKVLVEIHIQERSITGVNFKSKSGLWEKAIKEMRGEVEFLSSEDKRYINKILDYREVDLASHYYQEGAREMGEDMAKDVFLRLPNKERIIYKIIYWYARHGGRGGWRGVIFRKK